MDRQTDRHTHAHISAKKVLCQQEGTFCGAQLTCIQKPQSDVGLMAQVALINGCVGGLALEECHLLEAVICKPLAHQGITRGVIEGDVIADLS